LTNVAKTFIFMILYDFCLLRPQLCDKIIHVRNFESHMQLADRRAPWKLVIAGKCLVFRRSNLKNWI
jgi:hypothetical protein